MPSAGNWGEFPPCRIEAGGTVLGLIMDAKVNPRLYNLDVEISEQTNLAAQHPDIVVKLEVLATEMESQIGGKQPKSRRPAGEVAHPQTLYPTAGEHAARKGWISPPK